MGCSRPRWSATSSSPAARTSSTGADGRHKQSAWLGAPIGPSLDRVHRRDWLLLLALAALWGASYMFIKVALEDLSAEALVFARCALGAAVLIPIAVRRGAFAPLRGRVAGV